jgi:hypothetical protein
MDIHRALEDLQYGYNNLEKENKILKEALEHFINVCDHGVPVDFVKDIGDSCAQAKEALRKVENADY